MIDVRLGSSPVGVLAVELLAVVGVIASRSLTRSSFGTAREVGVFVFFSPRNENIGMLLPISVFVHEQ